MSWITILLEWRCLRLRFLFIDDVVDKWFGNTVIGTVGYTVIGTVWLSDNAVICLVL